MMFQRGVPYYDIWKIVSKYFPTYVKNNLEGSEDETILYRTNPFDYLNLTHFIRPVINHAQKNVTFSYEEFDDKLWCLLSDLKACENWRTDSLYKYIINRLFVRIRNDDTYDLIQKFIENHQLSKYENVFFLHDFHEYQYEENLPLEDCDLNMFFLKSYPEYCTNYKELAMQFYGDDTDAYVVYYKMFYLVLQKDDKQVEYYRFIEFLKELFELPASKDGFSPLGMMMYGHNGVIPCFMRNQVLTKEEGHHIYGLFHIDYSNG